MLRAAGSEDALRALVEAHPECFVKPKTRVMTGVKLGYQKGKGTLDYDDADAVVARIEKHLPKQVAESATFDNQWAARSCWCRVIGREVPVQLLADLPTVVVKKIGEAV